MRPHRLALAALPVLVLLFGRSRADDAPPRRPAEGPRALAARLDAAIDARLTEAAAARPSGAPGPARPAPDCGDELFLRRAAYDLTGGPVSAERARAFLDDRAPDKRARLVRELLSTRAAAVWWGRFLLEMTTEDGRASEQDGWDGLPLLAYFTRHVERRRGIDAAVRGLLTASGNREEGEVQWLLRWNVEPAKLAGSVGRDLLGLSIGCAQCHDHPYEAWRQDQFWSLAAHFGRLRYFEGEDVEGVTERRRASRSMSMPRDGEGDEEPAAGRRPPRRFEPRFLDGSAPGADEEPRPALAAWVTASPLFARNVANRVWARLLGQGLVEPLDSAGSAAADDPWVSGVLEPLAARLRGSKHDLLDLVEVIASTRAYARGPKASAARGPEASLPFAVHRPRPLTADQVRTTLVVGTGMYEDEDPLDEADEEAEEEAAPSMTAPGMTSGEDEGGEDEDEEGYEEEDGPPPFLKDLDPTRVPDEDDLETPRALGLGGTKVRGLALLSSAWVHDAVESGARLLTKLHGRDVGAAHVEHAFLALLSRRPTAEERDAALRAVREGGGRRRALEDVLWSLVNSAELGAVW